MFRLLRVPRTAAAPGERQDPDSSRLLYVEPTIAHCLSNIHKSCFLQSGNVAQVDEGARLPTILRSLEIRPSHLGLDRLRAGAEARQYAPECPVIQSRESVRVALTSGRYPEILESRYHENIDIQKTYII